MLRPFGPNEVWFIVQAVRWTLLLSAIAFVGGGIGGLIVALSRTAPLGSTRYRLTRLPSSGHVSEAETDGVPPGTAKS